MSTYTVTVQWMVEHGYQIFDDSWTTYVPEHKPELIDKILRYYWFYEIGQETPDRFRHYINEHLARIMPYYDQLYRSELLEIEPLFDKIVDEIEGVTSMSNWTKDMAKRSDDVRLKAMANSIKEISDRSGTLIRGVKGTYTESWSEDTTGSKNVDTDANIQRDLTTSEDTTGKSDTVTNDTHTGKDDTITTETVTDTLNSSKDTSGQSDTATSATRRYSDTPQGRIGSGGLAIDTMYLTNYTADSGSEHVDSSGNETLNNTEERKTDSSSITGSTYTNDGTSTTDTTGKKDGSEDEKTESHTDETTTYTEDRHGEKSHTRKDDTDQDTKERATVKTFSNSSDDEKTTTTGVQAEKNAKNDSVSKHRTIKATIVSQSELLMKFRQTFLNIDDMIIKELAEDFMGIF